MASQYFIGVDIGTAGTKAAIFDLQGNQLAMTYEESLVWKVPFEVIAIFLEFLVSKFHRD